RGLVPGRDRAPRQGLSAVAALPPGGQGLPGRDRAPDGPGCEPYARARARASPLALVAEQPRPARSGPAPAPLRGRLRVLRLCVQDLLEHLAHAWAHQVARLRAGVAVPPAVARLFPLIDVILRVACHGADPRAPGRPRQRLG